MIYEQEHYLKILRRLGRSWNTSSRNT